MVIVDVAREGVAALDYSSGLKSERPLLSVVPIVGKVRVVVVEADDVGVGPAHPLDVVEELSILPLWSDQALSSTRAGVLSTSRAVHGAAIPGSHHFHR